MNTNFSKSILLDLKSKGYKTIQTVLIESVTPYLARVQIIPVKEKVFGLDMVPLDSKDALEYCDENNQMVEYLINDDY